MDPKSKWFVYINIYRPILPPNLNEVRKKLKSSCEKIWALEPSQIHESILASAALLVATSPKSQYMLNEIILGNP